MIASLAVSPVVRMWRGFAKQVRRMNAEWDAENEMKSDSDEYEPNDDETRGADEEWLQRGLRIDWFRDKVMMTDYSNTAIDCEVKRTA